MNDITKVEHEQFVSGLHGTTCEEVLLLSFVSVLSAMIANPLHWPLKTVLTEKHYNWLYTILDTFILITPAILALTVLSNHVVVLTSLLVLLLFLRLLFDKTARDMKPISKRHIQSFTRYRGHLLLVTALAILAVDFPVFPRRFAKAETYGFGYMDLGVGSFVMASGLVARETTKLIRNRLQNLVDSVKSSIFLLVLGLSRILVTRLVNYQEHVSEYGTHWNFFLSLAFTRVFSTCLLSVFPVNSAIILSTSIIMAYQIALNQFGLADFILKDDRSNLFKANKEGIFSLAGYFAIYLTAVAIGKLVIKLRHSDFIKTFLALTMIALISYIAMHLSHNYIQESSRRFCNLTYLLWIISFGCFHLAFHTLTEKLVPGQSRVLGAVNHYGMFFFLAANVLTGLINLSVDTIRASAATALCCLYLMLTVLSSVVYYLEKNSIQL